MSTQTKQPKYTMEQLADGLNDVCFNLLTTFPFYGMIITNMNRSIVDEPDSIHISKIAPLNMASVNLEFNYRLWDPLTQSEKVGRLQKEVLHYVFLHPWAQKPKNLGMFYAACDITVNRYSDDKTSLRLENLNTLMSKYNASIDVSDGWFETYNSLIDFMKIMPSEMLKKHKGNKVAFDQELSEWQAKAAAGEFFEKGTRNLTEAFFLLPENSKGSPNVSSLLGGMFGNGFKGDGTDPDPDALKELVDKFLGSGTQDIWQAVSDNVSEEAAKETVKTLMRRGLQAGSIPGGMENYIDTLLAPPKVDWKRECRRFTKTAGGVVTSTTMSRRNKRFGTFPAMRITRTQRLAVIGDTSGSMTDKMFEQILSEINGAIQANCEVVFIQADTVVDDVKIYKKKIPTQGRVTRNGYGGTSFDDALEYVKTQGKLDKHSSFPAIGKVDGVIYVTDGYAPAPKISSYPRAKILWLTTEKKKETMESEGFRGKIVEILDDEY